MIIDYIKFILEGEESLLFTAGEHKYLLEPLWNEEYLYDNFGPNIIGCILRDLETGQVYYFKDKGGKGWRDLLDHPLEGGMTLRMHSDGMIFEPQRNEGT